MFQPNLFDAQQHHHHLLDMVNPMNDGTSQNELDLIRDVDDFDTNSLPDVMEGTIGDDDQDSNPRPNKKKRYCRHTQHQIQEMELFFKECPHPDDKQRKELGRKLGLEPLQIKFWFQNKRTQMKVQTERHENSQLRAENEKLRTDNIRFKETLSCATCPTCGGQASIGEMSFDEQQLRVENARLREEIDRISGIAAKYVGKSMLTNSNGSIRSLDLGIEGFEAPVPPGFMANLYGGEASGNLNVRSIPSTTEADKPMIVELAVAGMEELIRMAQAGDPLWIPNRQDGNYEILSEEEYLRAFPRGIGPKTVGLKSEASRDSAIVIMNHINLVEILMNVGQWSAMFSGIVSRAVTLEILSTGVAGTYDGALQVMVAEFQVPSPLVATRESYFVRYCKRHGDETWAVADISLDGLNPPSVLPPRCTRRPSGCIIQALPNGYSKVTWVEHVDADNRAIHDMYKPLVDSGLAFGARRWVATLERQCERLASAMASSIPLADVGVITKPSGRKNMLKLAERMVMSYCSGVGASTSQTWTTLSGSGEDDVRVMTRKSLDDPGRPPGVVLSAATSIWLPVSPKRMFDFLRDQDSRTEWDILSNGGIVHEMAHIANGRDHGNSISLLRVHNTNSNQSNMLILQESCTDATASYIIYAPVDIAAMDVVLTGGDPDYVALLPSGFAILPYNESPGGGGGSLITVAFQILVDSIPTARLSMGSVATVNSLIRCTVERIKASIDGDQNAGP